MSSKFEQKLTITNLVFIWTFDDMEKISPLISKWMDKIL